MTAVIVDDEELARQVLREFLASHPEVTIAAECGDGFDAVKTINACKPDLIFLDIQMPKLDGFEVLELVDCDAAVVFVTAYDAYALRAFEVHAVDYLLKPFSADRFDEALERAIRRRGERTPPPFDLAAAARMPSQYLERVAIRDGSKVHVIPVERLDYVEAQDDYICLHASGKRHLKQQTISQLEAALDPARFVRIHRSYLAPLDRIARIEPYSKDSRVAVLHDGTQLPVSRNGYERLKGLL